jgi:hypothetical protein
LKVNILFMSIRVIELYGFISNGTAGCWFMNGNPNELSQEHPRIAF